MPQHQLLLCGERGFLPIRRRIKKKKKEEARLLLPLKSPRKLTRYFERRKVQACKRTGSRSLRNLCPHGIPGDDSQLRTKLTVWQRSVMVLPRSAE